MATDPAIKLRNAIYDALVAATFDIGSIEVEKTYFPQENLEDLADKPKVKLIAFYLGADRSRELHQAGAYVTDVSVQIAIQQRVDPTDTDYIDNLHYFFSQILDLLEDDDLVSGEKFTWSRTEPLRDENGLIYSYDQLSQDHVFQVIFTAHYQYIRGN